MPKYILTIRFDTYNVTIDTDHFEDDFAKTKDDLADKLDPTDPDVVNDWFLDNWADHDLIELSEVEPVEVFVKPAK